VLQEDYQAYCCSKKEEEGQQRSQIHLNHGEQIINWKRSNKNSSIEPTDQSSRQKEGTFSREARTLT